MTIAFVTINVAVGSEEEVLENLKKVEAVKEAYIVFGQYDIIAKIRTESVEKLKNIVTNDIRTIDNVRSTLTNIVAEGRKK